MFLLCFGGITYRWKKNRGQTPTHRTAQPERLQKFLGIVSVGVFPGGKGEGERGKGAKVVNVCSVFPGGKKTKPQRNATHRIADLCSRHANDDDDAGVLENWGAGELGSWRWGGAGEAYRRDGVTHGI